MILKTKGIILRNTPFGENGVISSVYTEKLGLRKYMINGVKKNNAKIKMGNLMPLSLVDLEVYEKPNANFNRVKELKCNPILIDIHTQVKKRSIAMFLVEVLNITLQSEIDDEKLFNFVEKQILILEQDALQPTFPTVFLLYLLLELGLLPIAQYSEKTPYYDTTDMDFVGHYSINTKEKEVYKHFSQIIAQLHHQEGIQITPIFNKNIFQIALRIFENYISKNKPIQSVLVIQEILQA